MQTLGYLDPVTVFALKESERPSSVDIAVGLGLTLPERRVLRRVTELTRPTHAMLGYRPAKTEGGSRKPPIKPFYRQKKQAQSGAYMTDWQGRVVTGILGIICCLPFLDVIRDMAWPWSHPIANVSQKSAILEAETHHVETKAKDPAPRRTAGHPKRRTGTREADPTLPVSAELSALQQKVLPSLVTVNRGTGRGTGFSDRRRAGCHCMPCCVNGPDGDRTVPGRGTGHSHGVCHR